MGCLCALYTFSLCIQPKAKWWSQATLQQPEGLVLIVILLRFQFNPLVGLASSLSNPR